MKPRFVVCCALLCFCVTAIAFSQDAVKVDPKHYKVELENAQVRVLRAHYGPHEKSNLHAHPGGVVVILTAGHLRFTDENGKTQEVFAKPGESRWFPAFKHKVENLGDTAYSAVYIGIKGKHPNEAGMKDGSTELDGETRKLVAEALLAAMK